MLSGSGNRWFWRLYALFSVWYVGKDFWPARTGVAAWFQPLCVCFRVMVSLVLFAVIVLIRAIPKGTAKMVQSFQAIRLINAAGRTPLPTFISQKGDFKMIDLFTCGLPLETFRQKQAELESALNVRIAKIEEGIDRQHILLTCVPGDKQLPERVWLPPKRDRQVPSSVLLGESLAGSVGLDLNRVPHMLVGGSTGSGKTTLIKTVMYQLLEKRFPNGEPAVDVYLIDLKGGLDYPQVWKERENYCSVAVSAAEALSTLSDLVSILEERKILFGTNVLAPCSNLDEWNDRMEAWEKSCMEAHPEHRKESEPLRRIVVVVDEMAELSDTSGMSKAEKEQAATIVRHLATIARLGRAFGINLVIGTQRPDANAVPGQIKNNLDYRVCGKADNTLSMIILDHAGAADAIPKDSQGLFLNQEGVLFRGYLVQDSSP